MTTGNGILRVGVQLTGIYNEYLIPNTHRAVRAEQTDASSVTLVCEKFVFTKQRPSKEITLNRNLLYAPLPEEPLALEDCLYLGKFDTPEGERDLYI